jgi:membrane protease YdiL (CAAX protease family)
MLFDGLINALLVGAGAYVYLSLVRQIGAREELSLPVPRTFGFPEAIAAASLITWFLVNISAASSREPASIRPRDLIVTIVFSFALVFFIALLLRFRRIDVSRAAGFSKLSFSRVLSTGAVLLFAASPIIFFAAIISERVLHTGSAKQQIVEMFNGSATLQERVMIIFLAIVVAPLTEEFIFRFFLYGVFKRYFGRGAGVLLNALLFAAVHANLPSLAPLFVLGTCFTIAYEWSGSLLVPMTMHALFNCASLVLLAFPEALPP